MAHIERDNVLGERVGAGSGFEREFDAEEQEGFGGTLELQRCGED